MAAATKQNQKSLVAARLQQARDDALLGERKKKVDFAYC